MDISKKILSDPVNKWVFSRAGTGVFLVGGYVRDLLRGQISKDKDFVLKDNAEDTAIKAAKKFNGTLVALKPGQTYRVVLKSSEVLDFTSLKLSIYNDLKERDFTINSIAWSPETGITDPFGGRENLNNRTVRAVMIKNLLDDPLRIIRAYRIAAELGFKIEGKTKKYLKYYSKKISDVASERITEEFFKILSNAGADKYLIEIHKEKILEKILVPNDSKKNNRLSDNIKALKLFDSGLKALSSDKTIGKGIVKHLDKEISQGLNMLGLMRLALLLKCNAVSHSRLTTSRNINNSLRDIHSIFKKEKVINRNVRKLSKEEIFEIFKTAGGRVIETAIILSFLKKQNTKNILKKAEEFVSIKNKNLLNGNDVQKILNVKPGKYIGRILSDLKDRQIKGRVKTKAEAKRWLLLNYT